MGAKFYIKKSKSGQYFFDFMVSNGKFILRSELYRAKIYANRRITFIIKNAGNDSHYVRMTSGKKESYFIFKEANGHVIGKSKIYSSVAGMENGITSFKKNAAAAEVEDCTV